MISQEKKIENAFELIRQMQLRIERLEREIKRKKTLRCALGQEEL